VAAVCEITSVLDKLDYIGAVSMPIGWGEGTGLREM
jgi:hypothetical protein